MTESSCPRCKAYWIRSATTCKFCGFSPASQGMGPSEFDPDHRPGAGDPAFGAAGSPGGKPSRRLGGSVVTVAAIVVAVGLAGAIAYVASQTILEEEHGNHALSGACAGEGSSAAAPYDPSKGASEVLELRRSGDSWNGDDDRAASEIDLVACRTRSAEPHRTIGCQERFDAVQESDGDTRTLEDEMVTYSAQLYRITVEFREARTGDLVATEHATPPVSCPQPDDGGLLVLDMSTKRYPIIPDDQADALVASYTGKPTSDASADETAGS